MNGALADESMQIVRVAARPARSLDEFERLVAAIERRDGAGAVRAAERYVHAARRVALTALAENSVTA